MDDNSLMPFGKYQGEKLANVPASYLLWLHEQKRTGIALGLYIRENMDVLKKQAEEENRNRK